MSISKLTKKTFSLVSALSLMITSASFPSVMAEGETESVVFPEATETITVSPGDSIQEALNNAGDNSDSEYTEVVLNSGTYQIDLPLRVYSNTIIQAEGATIERTYNNPADLGPGLIRNVSKDGTAGKDNKLGKYDVTKNVYLNGGTWSGGSLPDNVVSSTNIVFCHAENIYLLNADFQNNYNGHLVEINAVNNCLIQNCSFNGLKKSNNSDSYVALQIDIAHSYSNCKRSDGEHKECPTHDSIPVGYYPDDTACKNIRILSNSFNNKKTEFGNFDSACGSNKTLTDGAGPIDNPGAPVYHENITISYNTINDCSYVAIASRGHKNVTIKGNSITNCGEKGIIVKRCLGGTVADNILTDIADMGILLFGESTLPATDPNRNITQLDSINNNTITRAGYHGIAVQNESSVANIDGNTITDAKGHGISAIGNSKITASLQKNTINNSTLNGINIYDHTKVNSITDNSISGAKNNGIIINKNSTVTGKISKNIVKNSTIQGIRVADGSTANTIEQNNVADSEDGIGLWSNASAVSISQNTVSGSKQNGIVLSTNCKITGNIEGNTVSNSGKNGIFIYSSSSVASVKSNKVSNSTSHGISVSTNSSVSEISSNSISGSKGNGISVGTKSKVNKISGNTFSNNTANCKVSKDSQVAQNDAASTVKQSTPKTTKAKKPTVKKVKSLKVKSKKKKTVNVTWKKLSGVNGYIVEYSLKRTFKNVKTKKINKNSKKCTIKKLKSKKRYFFRIKAYKNYGSGKVAYGAYSAIKKVKVK